jgi:hypothetical protein
VTQSQSGHSREMKIPCHKWESNPGHLAHSVVTILTKQPWLQCINICVQKTKHMFMSHYQNAGQNLNIKTANNTTQNMKMKYLGTTVRNQNYIHSKIKTG